MRIASKLCKRKLQKQGPNKFRCHRPALVRLQGKKPNKHQHHGTSIDSTARTVSNKQKERVEEFINVQLLAVESIDFELLNSSTSALSLPSTCGEHHPRPQAESELNCDYFLNISGEYEGFQEQHSVADLWTPPPTPPLLIYSDN